MGLSINGLVQLNFLRLRTALQKIKQGIDSFLVNLLPGRILMLTHLREGSSDMLIVLDQKENRM
jgi:hypothetical protein